MRLWFGIVLLVLLLVSSCTGAEQSPLETISGNGEEISQPFPLPEGLIVFDIQHNGDDIYAVYLYDEHERKIKMLSIGSGPEEISTAVKIPKSGDYFLNVTGKGSWEVSMSDPHDVDREILSTVSGIDSQATPLYHFSAGQNLFDIRYTGESNFIVEMLDTDGNYVTTLANAIDTWNGEKTVTIPKEGDYLFDIECEGTWKISTKPALTSNQENLLDTGSIDPDGNSPINIGVSPVSLPDGSPLTITGSVLDIPEDGVAIWIIGDKSTWYGTGSVKKDKTFFFKVGEDITENLPAGDYSVIVQHPMNDGTLSVFPEDYGFVSEIQTFEDGKNILLATVREKGGATREEIIAIIDQVIMSSDDDYAQVDIEITPGES